jgi:DNA-binding XRE family transcriptional regulator
MSKMTRQEREARDNAFAELMQETNPGFARPDSSIQQRMIETRVRAGLTQDQLARRLGTTQSSIARLEGGRRMPNLKLLERLAEATGSVLVVRFEEK